MVLFRIMTHERYPFQASSTVQPGNHRSLAVIWDMDGVLVDTGEFHYQVWKEVLAGYDIRLKKASFRQTFGMNNDGLLRYYLKDRYNPELAKQISQQKESQLRRIIRGQIKPFPGALELLNSLSQKGTPQALASSAPLANIKAILAELALEDSFQVTLSAEFMPGKPDPAVFLEAALQLDVPPERCIVIEDALPGVQAAKRAGMRCLAVATTNAPKALSAADRVIDSLELIQPDDLLRL